MNIADLTAIGDVEAHDRDPTAGRGDRPGLDRLFRGEVFRESGLMGECVGVCEANAGGDGDPIPLVCSADGYLIPGVGEGVAGKLVLAAFCFLHGEDVDVVSVEHIDDSWESGADGVDIPGGQSHMGEPTSCVTYPGGWWCARWTHLTGSGGGGVRRNPACGTGCVQVYSIR